MQVRSRSQSSATRPVPKDEEFVRSYEKPRKTFPDGTWALAESGKQKECNSEASSFKHEKSPFSGIHEPVSMRQSFGRAEERFG